MLMNNVLVTGGAGFIGSNLVKKLIQIGCDVTSIDNYSTGTNKNEVTGAKYINDDIENIFKLKQNFDVCFHLDFHFNLGFRFTRDVFLKLDLYFNLDSYFNLCFLYYNLLNAKMN